MGSFQEILKQKMLFKNLSLFSFLSLILYAVHAIEQLDDFDGKVGNRKTVVKLLASPGEFPHLVGIFHNNHYACGGSLIAEDVVLTSAVCCSFGTASDLIVRAGSFHLYEEDAGEEDIKIKEVIMHEKFDGDYYDDNYENDICLLVLEGKADLNNPNIGLIELSDSFLASDTRCTVIGYGIGGQSWPGLVVDKFTMSLWTNQKCASAYSGIGTDLFKGSICASNPAEGPTNFCWHDIGGPLICENKIAGISSWNHFCQFPGLPGVYTEVNFYHEWISTHMKTTTM